MWEPWPVRRERVSQQLRVSPQPVETPWRFPAMRWWLPGWIVSVSSSLRSRLWRIQKAILQGRKKEEINNHGTILDPAQLSAELNRRCALMIMPINCQFPFICCVSLSSLLPHALTIGHFKVQSWWKHSWIGKYLLNKWSNDTSRWKTQVRRTLLLDISLCHASWASA